ncbi:MAG: hypothetical protein ACLR7D_16155 [Lachnospira eligens]
MATNIPPHNLKRSYRCCCKDD